MSEEERGAFESAFVADERLFEQVRVVEDELVEAYVRGTLAPAERDKFERGFLADPRRRSRVEFTRALLGRLTEQRGTVAAMKRTDDAAAAKASVWDSIVSFFKPPALAYGAAFALLALIVGGWLLLRSPNRSEVARQGTPTPTAAPARTNANESSTLGGNVNGGANANSPAKIPDATNAPPTPQTGTPNGNQNAQPTKRAAQVAPPVLALFAGAARGDEGKTPELNLPPDAPGARLRLRLESQDYKIYRAEVVDPDGARVFRSRNLTAKNSVVNLFVPARALARGDYLVKLSALNQQHEPESVADYSLRVTRK